MKHSIEELITYMTENKLTSSVVNAMMNNDKGFSLLPVPDAKIIQEGSEYFIWSDIEGFVKISLDMSTIEADVGYNKNYILNHPEGLSVAIVQHTNTMEMYVLSQYNISEDAQDDFVKTLAKDFFEYAGIDTFGKLKVICDRGYEIAANFIQVKNKYNLSDIIPKLIKL